MTLDVCMICVGDELLDGTVRDLNLVYLGQTLSEWGARLKDARWVRDTQDEIVAALNLTDSKIIVVSGGLGPTADDITREAASVWCDRELRENADALETLKARFSSHGYRFTPNNRRQVLFPKGARILENQLGTAPGFCVEHDGKHAYFFPGVPSEFRTFCQRHLAHLFTNSSAARRRLYFHGLGESQLESRLTGLQALAQKHQVDVGFRADYPVIEVKLVGPSTEALEPVIALVNAHIGPWGIGQDDVHIADLVGQLLTKEDATVTTAESCTAGGIAAAITDSAGSSAWFEQGFVTYSNAAKTELIGVLPQTLEAFGAVSAQTVCQMAAGAQKRTNADYALAVSGIAGPGGGTPEKPVGTVHFGLATPEGIYHRLVHFQVPSRQAIRAGTIYSALSMLIWRLDGRLNNHEVRGPFEIDHVMRPEGIPL